MAKSKRRTRTFYAKYQKSCPNRSSQRQIFLRTFRSTPHSTTHLSPHKLLFGQEPGTKLGHSTDISDTYHENDATVRLNDQLAKQHTKRNADTNNHASERQMKIGDQVLIRNERKSKLTPPFDPEPAIVKNTNGTMITVFHKDRKVTRNSSFFKILKARNTEEKPQTLAHHEKKSKSVTKSYEIPPPVPIITQTATKQPTQRNNINTGDQIPAGTPAIRNRRQIAPPEYLKDYVTK